MAITLTLSESPHWVEKNLSLEKSTEFSPFRHLIGIDNDFDANVSVEIVFKIYNDIYIDKQQGDKTNWETFDALVLAQKYGIYSFLLLIV